jgi:hypothetical protein
MGSVMVSARKPSATSSASGTVALGVHQMMNKEEEEGGYENIADHHGVESGKEEAHVEPAILVQSLSGVDEQNAGQLLEVKGGPGICQGHCSRAHHIWSHAGSAGPSMEQEAGRFWRKEIECGLMVVGQLGAEETRVGGAMVEHGELKRRKC